MTLQALADAAAPSVDQTTSTALAAPADGGGQPQGFAGTGGPSVGFTPVVVRTSAEILVNTAVTNDQNTAEITTLVGGGFVIAWRDTSLGDGGASGDASGAAIKAQLFTAAGAMVGIEILVNTAVVNDQTVPRITALSDGGFVITWLDYSAGVGGATGDASSGAVKAQLFTAAGLAVGGEILVNTATANNQDNIQATALAGGGFVVTWRDGSLGLGGATGDSSGTAVKAQIFTNAGAVVGTEILVNTATVLGQTAPQITSLSNGGFVVTWGDSSSGVGGATGDASSTAIKAQAFAADGTLVNGEILVNTATQNGQDSQQITALADGGFVVTWRDSSQGAGGAGGDPTTAAIKAQVFTAAGAMTGTEIRVNTATANNQDAPQITALVDGGFVVTWRDGSRGAGGAIGDVSSNAVKAQVFTAAGVAVGTEILVNTAITNSQDAPQITALVGGGFVVTWRDASLGADGAPGDTSDVAAKAQVFAANGTPVGGEILVNTATLNAQDGAQVTALPNGGFVISWRDMSAGVGGATGDTSFSAVKAQVFGVGPTAVEQVALDLKNTGFTVADPDAGDSLTVTLSTTYGVLTVAAGTSGASVAGSGTASVTLTGTATEIAALLNTDGTSSVTFYADTDTPPASATITLVADDGAGGTASTSLILPIENTSDISTTPSTGADVLSGTVGADSLSALGGDDTIDGGGGDDLLDGGAGDDTLNGGDGADYLRGGSGADTMVGGLGADTYVVTDAGDTVDETGGDGVDLVITSQAFTLGAGLENLTLAAPGRAIDGTGNGLDNVLLGNSFANTLNGLDGADTLNGDGGNDILNGDDGDDSLNGGGQNDTLNGGAGIDTLTGGVGNDTLDGGTGADSMTGGLGTDAFLVDDAGDAVIEAAGEGADTVFAAISYSLTANVENLTLTGSGPLDGTGNGLKNTIVGNSGANTLHGGGDIDTLSGGDGADTLYGDAGHDVLGGGNGDDVLIGGAGYDRLTGGAGADTFAFTSLDIHLSAAGTALVEKDTLVDLSFAANDRIDLSAIDANVGLDGDQAFSFVGKFTRQAGQAVLSLSGGISTLQLDVDGDGRADFTIAITGNVTGTTGNLYTGGGDLDGGWVL